MSIVSTLRQWIYVQCYKAFLWLVEAGLVPDMVIRIGIRALLRERLKIETAGSVTEFASRKQKLVEKFKTMPIAVETEAANEQHYELPTEYFDLCLGKWKKYSSCLYNTPQDSIDTAEENMLSETMNPCCRIDHYHFYGLDLYCKKAGMQDGMSVLDLGCGWGSLALFFASRYPNCQVTAVSNSQTQKDYINATAKQLGLENVKVISCDINDFYADQTFDRIVSIEMFEHMKNYKLLLHKISTWLKPRGKVFIHHFFHNRFLYEFKVESEDDWMAKYFFTGGTMPSLDLLTHYQEDLVVKKTEYINGIHYSRTLEEWLRTMDNNKQPIQALFKGVYGGEYSKWFMYWRLFYLACSELFNYNNGNEWGIAHVLLEQRQN